MSAVNMSAVVRVKRRIDEEPLNAFVLNCKRRKVDEDHDASLLMNKDEISTILKFAGTVESQDENIAEQITKLTKDEAKQLALKTRKSNITEKKRQEMKNASQDNRFKVVNCYRATSNDDEDVSVAGKEITVVDIEKQPADVGQASSTKTRQNTPSSSNQQDSNNNDFVYDLYLPECDQQTEIIDENLVDNLLSIKPFDDLVYDTRINNESDNESYECDSDDSNDENCWRNEYPDTDEGSSIGDEDMRRAVEDLDIDNELSSDEEDNHHNNGFVYSVDSEAIGFEDDIDYCEINRYGESHARYMAKLRREYARDNNHEYNSDIDYSDYGSDT